MLAPQNEQASQAATAATAATAAPAATAATENTLTQPQNIASHAAISTNSMSSVAAIAAHYHHYHMAYPHAAQGAQTAPAKQDGSVSPNCPHTPHAPHAYSGSHAAHVLQGKTMLVLGATSDIARATITELIAQGWSFHLAGRNLHALKLMAEDIANRSGKCVAYSHFDAVKNDLEQTECFWSNVLLSCGAHAAATIANPAITSTTTGAPVPTQIDASKHSAGTLPSDTSSTQPQAASAITSAAQTSAAMAATIAAAPTSAATAIANTHGHADASTPCAQALAPNTSQDAHDQQHPTSTQDLQLQQRNERDDRDAGNERNDRDALPAPASLQAATGMGSDIHDTVVTAPATPPDATAPSSLQAVYCAIGLLEPQAKVEQSIELTQTMLQANFTGLIPMLTLAANYFEAQKHGHMLIISSVAGERGRRSNYVYGATKAGLTAFLSGLRVRLHQSGVQVLTILPGLVRTKMIAKRKVPAMLTATPQLVAKDIVAALNHNKSVLYTPWYWRYIMCVVKHIPECIYVKLHRI